MIEKKDIENIKKITEEFFSKTTIEVSNIEAKASTEEQKEAGQDSLEPRDSVEVDIKSQEPQILIGQGGQTLFEIQRLLRMVLNKKTGKIFYLNLDINDYKKKKIDYLIDLAKSSADQVVLTKIEKDLLPMPPYERRIIHAELAKRTDVITESRGEGQDRHIVIKPS